MQKSDSIANLVKALSQAQNEFSPVLKDKDNPFFHSKYADLAGVIEATQPALIKNGLVVSQFPISENGRVGVLTILAHASGEYVAESYTLPTAKQDAQTGVAAVTYARRAAYQGVVGVAAEDDDGNTANNRRVSSDINEEPESAQTISPEVIPVPMETGALPTEEQLDNYRARVKNLQLALKQAGLRASNGIAANKKVINYLQIAAGVDDIKQVTVTKWNALLDLIEKTKSQFGIEKLVELINNANLKENAIGQ